MNSQTFELAHKGLEKLNSSDSNPFKEHEVIEKLKHYLPAQAPLKDFIHHNTLHSFQHDEFFTALENASTIFGYSVLLPVDEYRDLYRKQSIREDILLKIIENRKGKDNMKTWLAKAFDHPFKIEKSSRLGLLRSKWKSEYALDISSKVHPKLFRIVCSYLDQGISMWNFPVWHRGFLSSIKEMELHSYTSFFRTKKAKDLLLHGPCDLVSLLKIVVGDERYYEQYLFDQQFAHPGWSGIVSSVEDNPQTLLDHKKISLHDFIVFELLLEIDIMEHYIGSEWRTLTTPGGVPVSLFRDVERTEYFEVLSIWQEAYEWSYYDQVLAAIKSADGPEASGPTTFQALFCIDDRECSFRRYLEKLDPACQTFGTPGFFGVEFYFKPEHGKSYTKLCPAPVTPRFLIKEQGRKGKQKKDLHLQKNAHSLFRGWLITQTIGLWAALRLFLNIFKPSLGPAAATSFQHMDKDAHLTIETNHPEQKENGLQVGFTVEEMASRVENLLKSIGLINDFSPIVYVVGHGSSSVNNPHYAAYDCGACSGRPGSVNARVSCFMANHPKVREILKTRGINIPTDTIFIGGLHDTTRDEVTFYDEPVHPEKLHRVHNDNVITFKNALALNAKERSRRFELVDSKAKPSSVHEKIKKRSVSLFEPRPELNHATNALCIVGRRDLSRKVFLDRRCFLNSYDYRIDPQGNYLLNILKAAAPVCGGINLEYYFSRVDNASLGAGTKLPHNVMGLFGVANGIDGDLRPGLPSQMIEVHDPLRLLIIVEHYPDTVLDVIQRNNETYEWFSNHWVKLVAIHPENRQQHVFENGSFSIYTSMHKAEKIQDMTSILESHHANLPVFLTA